jgi:hypothetical protein
MSRMAMQEVLEALPVREVEESLKTFLRPIIERMPDVRLGRVVALSIQGIVGSESPVVLQMAQAIGQSEGEVWGIAKRLYGLLSNERLSHSDLSQGLYEISQANVAQAQPEYLVIAVDPVNFEKPYSEALEGVSIVRKSTPPDLNGAARLTRGYPSITAAVVNTAIPATSYAHWFSYEQDFLSENVEIQQAFNQTNQLFPNYRRRYVLDAGFDDQRWFSALSQDEFVLRVSHLERLVEVYNDRLARWELETLGDLVAVVPFTHTFTVHFSHARTQRQATLDIGWFRIRLPTREQNLCVIVAHEAACNRTLVLLTNIPLLTIADVRTAYDDWRLRSRIEHGYRFDQEQGLDVEDMRVQTLERMKRLFILVLTAAQFVFFLINTWPAPAVLWIRSLGGKLGLRNDLDGPYLFLRGLSALFQTVATLSFLAIRPFPRLISTYG